MKLFTIGYEGLSQDVFLKLLRTYGINVVADVRELPLSRKKGFSKTALAEFLNKQEIQYVNYRDLGASKEQRRQLKQSGDYFSFFEAMKKSISSKIELLDEICGMIHEGKKVILLCFEKDPQKCHRKIVADEIKRRDADGLTIKHIEPI